MDALASLRARVEAQRAKAADSGIPYCPHKPSPRQAAFLAVRELEAFYGGAAGGGKSDALLMCQLRFIERPRFSGLILRRTLTDLALPGAIMDRAKGWFAGMPGVTWNEVSKTARHVNGGRMQFGFCESPNDVFRYQGSEFHSICIDEVTQWQERTYRYLLSRLRRKMGDDIPLTMRCAGNPGGIGHKWVKARFVKPGDPSRPFVPALAKDNPGLNVEEYERTLALLDETTKDQLLRGLWVEDTTGRVYRYDPERNGIPELPALDGWHAVLAIDLGASEVKATTAFALVMWHPEHAVAYCVRSWAEAGMIPSTCAARILEVQELFPEMRIVMDVGALGIGYANEMRQRYSLNIEAAQKRDKQGFRRLINGAFERSELQILTGECAQLTAELESLVWASDGRDADPSQDDHCSDALLYGWRMAQSWRAAYHVPEPELTEEQAWEKRTREAHARKQRDEWSTW